MKTTRETKRGVPGGARPPRLATWLLRFRIPAEHIEYVTGDLEEWFCDQVERHGKRVASWRFWLETFSALRTSWPRGTYTQLTDLSGDRLMTAFFQDFRYAVHMMRARPGFTFAALLTLALCIGANATIFSWINRVLLDPLPGVDSSRLVELRQESAMGSFALSYPDYVDYRDRMPSSLLAGRENWVAYLNAGGGVERLETEVVTANFFEVLGVQPVLGRSFSPQETESPGAEAPVLISYGLWQRSFGGDAQILGRKITINSQTFTVIGVTPQRFQGSTMALQIDAWVPMSMHAAIVPGGDRLKNRGVHWFKGIARLGASHSLERAQSEVDAATMAIVEAAPEYKTVRARLISLSQSDNGGIAILRPVLLSLMSVVVLILLIACANIANLLLARATSRRREIAIRLSMGATRRRLVRQLLTEGLVLSLCGGAGGLVVAYLSSGLLASFAPPTDLPIRMDVSLDSRVLLFTFGVSTVATLLFALIPALRLSRTGLTASISEGSSRGGARNRMRYALVVIQVSLSLALLVAAGLSLRSLRNIQAFDAGFDRNGVLLASLDLFAAGYDRQRGTQVLRDLVDGLESIPGVTSRTIARHVPLGLTGLSSSSVEIEGYQPAADEVPIIPFTPVGPDYLRTMGITLLKGRDIARSDEPEAPRVAVISEAMAERYWGGREALGGRFRFGSNGPWVTVVGVARDLKWREVRERDRAFAYLSVFQAFHPSTVIHLRTSSDPLMLAGAVRDLVRRIDPSLTLSSVRTLAGHVSASTFQQRMAGSLLGTFGLLAIVLAAVGLYGVLAFTVGQRTREIGLRIALGAMPRQVFRMVVRHGLLLTGIGLGFGMAAAYALGLAMSSLLFGVSPADPWTMTLGACVLLATSGLASFLPALRATRVDPTVALRGD